jgi:aldose 1-epimerase
MKKLPYHSSVKACQAGIALLVWLLLVTSCKSGGGGDRTSEQKNPKCKVEKSFFGMTPAGDSVTLFTLKNEKDYVVKIINYGAIITEIQTPDRDGKMGNIVLGFDNLQQYLGPHPYFGAVVGRYGNRAKGI